MKSKWQRGAWPKVQFVSVIIEHSHTFLVSLAEAKQRMPLIAHICSSSILHRAALSSVTTDTATGIEEVKPKRGDAISKHSEEVCACPVPFAAGLVLNLCASSSVGRIHMHYQSVQEPLIPASLTTTHILVKVRGASRMQEASPQTRTPSQKSKDLPSVRAAHTARFLDPFMA